MYGRTPRPPRAAERSEGAHEQTTGARRLCIALRATPDEASGATQTLFIAQGLGWEDSGRRPRRVKCCNERNEQREYGDPDAICDARREGDVVDRIHLGRE